MNKYIIPICSNIPLFNNNGYNYNCFTYIDNHIDVNEYYNILKHSSFQNLKNIINYIFINWNITKKQIDNKYPNNKYKNVVINNNINNIQDFNDNIKEFINNDLILSIFTINNIVKYISVNF
jgi:hypothetical protein